MPLIDNAVQSPFGKTGILNALGGSLPDNNWVRLRQPWLDNSGRACVTIRDVDGGFTRNDAKGGEKKPLLRNYLINELRNRGYNLPMVCNAATLRKEDWIQMERKVLKEKRQRLRAIADLEGAGLTIGGFNALGKMTYEYQAMSDPGEAVVDLDLTTDGRTDTPLFNIRSTPLPVTHSDFGYSAREIQVSRSGDTPLDLAMTEAATRRVAESLEDQLIGNVTGMTYGTQTAGPGTHTGTSTVYGYRNFPQRLTKTNMTAPTTGGWTPETTFNEILTALSQLNDQFFYGPFLIYFSTDWSQYINRNFSVSGGNNSGETLRSMLMKIEDVSDVRRLDRLTATFTILIVSMQSDTISLIDGVDFTTLQWEEKGGLELRFKVWAMKVPLIRATYAARCGVLQATTA